MDEFDAAVIAVLSNGDINAQTYLSNLREHPNGWQFAVQKLQSIKFPENANESDNIAKATQICIIVLGMIQFAAENKFIPDENSYNIVLTSVLNWVSQSYAQNPIVPKGFFVSKYHVNIVKYVCLFVFSCWK